MMKTLILMAALAAPAAQVWGIGRPAPWAGSASIDKACDIYLAELKGGATADELRRSLKGLTAFAARHPESHSRLVAGLMEQAQRLEEPFSLKAVLNALVDIAHVSSEGQRGKILSFFLSLRQKSGGLELYDHLSWAIKQLRPESVFGEVY